MEFITGLKQQEEAELEDLLKAEEGTPIILFRCITYGIVNGREIPIENFKCYYRTDKFKFYIANYFSY